MPQIEDAILEMEKAMSLPSSVSLVKLGVFLLLGGIFGLVIRLLYRKCSTAASGADTISRVFPLLIIVTCGVITVVKSSLALSLGLVGALSIVRFRAAIKDPEELVYLFLCIAVGLSLGAELPWLATALVIVSALFILGMALFGRKRMGSNLMLTITSRSELDSSGSETEMLNEIKRIVGRHTIERVDRDEGHCQVRVLLGDRSPSQIGPMLEELSSQLPNCNFSYVNMNSVF